MSAPGQQRQPQGRPGAMTMAMQAVQMRPGGPKVLRIGLMQSTKMVEERIIRKRETVTVGLSERNHFTINAKSLGGRFELFQLVGQDYILNFTEEMQGRVGLPGGVSKLDELRTSGSARNAGTHFQVKLNDQSRGRVEIGETTILFQFVVPPPVQPRPQLPAAVVGGFIAGIDWLFTAFVMFSFFFFFGFIIYLENADWPVEPTLAAIPERYADLIFNEPEPPEPEEPEEAEEAEESEEAEAEEVQEPTPRRREPQQREATPQAERASGETREDTNARLAVEEAQNQVEQMLLGALGGEGGAFQDVLAAGAVTGNAADVISQAEGVGVASNAEGGTLRERSGGGRVGSRTAGLGGLAASKRAGQARAEGGAVRERAIRGRVRSGALEDEAGSGDFDPSVVAGTIRRRIRAIQRCYERELRNNPTLSGRVLVRFTIVPAGTISSATATENTTGSDAVARCVVSTIRRFRFNPGPDGGSVTYAYPFVFAPQN